MLRFLVDEDIEYALVAAVRRDPDIDIVRAQEVGLTSTPDEILLERAAQEGRIFLTRDAESVIGFAYDRVRAGLSMPGVFIVPTPFDVGWVAEQVSKQAYASGEDEWRDQVVFLRAYRSDGGTP